MRWIIFAVVLLALMVLPLTFAQSQQQSSWDDPFSYCQSVGTVDEPSLDRRYTGPSTTPLMLTAPGLTRPDADHLAWRCANGRVLVCATPATTGCIKAPRTNPRQWDYVLKNPSVRAECRSETNAECASATHCIVGCSGGVPIINSNPYPIDKRGYSIHEWHELTVINPSLSKADKPNPEPSAQGTEWRFPVQPTGEVTGFFDTGYRDKYVRQHLGLDLPVPARTDALSPTNGTVVRNGTAAPDVNKAYLVIKETSGTEHVLGHIASGLAVGSSVHRGEVVGTVRSWPGQPGRSHVHWGANRTGVIAAMGEGPFGEWGWGQAPVAATKANATTRGWINFNSLVSAAPAQAANVYPDPVAYCRAVGAIDAPGSTYRGPSVPDWMYRALERTPSDPGPMLWRCAGGVVLACIDVSNVSDLRCRKPASDRSPNESLLAFCRQRGANGLSSSAGSIYTWQCVGGVPVLKWRRDDFDAQGFEPLEWKLVTPAMAASRPVPMDARNRMRSEEPCYQGLRAAMLASRADGEFDSAALSTCTPDAFRGHRGPARVLPENAAPGEWCFQAFRNARLDLDAGRETDGKILSECTFGGNASGAWERAEAAGVGVQIGTYSGRAAAEAGWSRLSQQYGALNGMRHRVVEVSADFGTVYRLQAVAENVSAANALCNGLKASGLNCHVKP